MPVINFDALIEEERFKMEHLSMKNFVSNGKRNPVDTRKSLKCVIKPFGKPPDEE